MQRTFTLSLMLASAFLSLPVRADDNGTVCHVPIRQITHGPTPHWFGYYDKQQISTDNRHVLGAALSFEGRTPEPEDTIALGMVDTQNGDAWIDLATTRAWSWQQGCMLQWVPGRPGTVIYNDRRDGQFVAVMFDVETREERVLPRAIYTVSPKGDMALGLDFARLDHLRPGYGYKGVVHEAADQKAPAASGIYRIDLATGEVTDIVPLDAVTTLPWDLAPQGRHWFNHLLFNPDGTRFIFLHRAEREDKQKSPWITRMLTASPDGSNLHIVADEGMVSHFIWHDPVHILTWSREEDTGNNFHYYTDQQDVHEVIGKEVLTRDGHCTYSPDGKWILTDTYPDKDRLQHLMLYRPADGKLVPLGAFYMPKVPEAELRCDLHPRWSSDGNTVSIDSMHNGNQRQMYLLDVSAIIQE